MIIIEIGTGYTSIPAQIGAATEIVIEELTRAFFKKGYKVKIVDTQDPSRIESELNISEVKTPFFSKTTDEKLGLLHKLKRVVYSFCLANQLRRMIREADEKLVLHFHNQYNLFFFLLLVPERLRKNAYIAYTVHSHVWHGNWDEIKKIIKFRYFQECACVKRADGVFVLNEKTLKNIVEKIGVDDRQVHLIDNGVNPRIYYPQSKTNKERIKSEYGLLNKKVYIQVGSVCERKNQLGAIKLLMPFMKNDRNIFFCYAGGIISEEYQKSIREFSEENGVSEQVKYFGEIIPGKQLNDFYSMAEAMVFPSKAEGFSLVILEAMSAGVPVIVSDELCFPLIDQCIHYSNEDGFLSCVCNYIMDTDKRKEISCRLRSVITEKYSWERIGDEYLAIWEK